MDLIVSKKQEFQCKLITIGDTNVGKTCVTTRFVENKYTFDNIATIGKRVPANLTVLIVIQAYCTM